MLLSLNNKTYSLTLQCETHTVNTYALISCNLLAAVFSPFLGLFIDRLLRNLLKLSLNDFLKDFRLDMVESSVADVSDALRVHVAVTARL